MCPTTDEVSLHTGPSCLLSYAHTISAKLKHLLTSTRGVDDADMGIQADTGGLIALRPGKNARSKAFSTTLQTRNTVDVTSLPDYVTGLRLLEDYFDHIGVLFPFLHRESFLSVYTDFRVRGRTVRRAWLAMLNLTMALALQRMSEPVVGSGQRSSDSWPFVERAVVLCDTHALTRVTLETGMSRRDDMGHLAIIVLTAAISSIPTTSHAISARHE
jgi:hypothetical protein